MRIVYSTASLERAPDQATALRILLAADLGPIELGELPGEIPAPDPGIVSAQLAFLPPGPGRVNLAAADDDLRRKGVQAITEALARCQWLGIPRYHVEAGWNLDQTLPRIGPGMAGSFGPPLGSDRRPHALAQLERSLERLALEAENRGLELGVINMAPDSGGLMTTPAEIRQVLRTVGAPNLRLSLALANLAAAGCRSPEAGSRSFDPDEAAASLADITCAVRVPAWTRRPEPWIVRVCAHLAPLPLVLGATVSEAAWLRSLGAALAEQMHLHATA